MALQVKQSKRSLKPLLAAQALERKQRQQQRKQQQRAAGGGGGAGGGYVAAVPTQQTPYEVVLDDGRVAPLVGPIRHVKTLKNYVVCEGPPFGVLWVREALVLPHICCHCCHCWPAAGPDSCLCSIADRPSPLHQLPSFFRWVMWSPTAP